MPKVPLCIPQLGEGLQEARLVKFLKQPGDVVKRDEPLFEMETDKAVSEVESPYDGVLAEWMVEEDTVHDIGAEIGKMEVASDVPVESSAGHDTPVSASSAVDSSAASSESDSQPSSGGEVSVGDVPIPPRTRRYLKEKNLEAVAAQIPAAGSRLTEDDVDRYLAQTGGAPAGSGSTVSGSTGSGSTGSANDPFDEAPLSSSQQTLNYRMARGAQVVIPATLETDLDWRNIQQCREQTRPTNGATGFAMLLWCVAQSMKDFPSMRSTLSADGKTVRTYRHVNLGIAVALPGDDLKTAVVQRADTLSQSDFFQQLNDAISAARDGKDQVDASTTVSVSNIGATDMRSGIPVVVAPAVATIAVGQVRPQAVADGDGFAFQPHASITMSFDHRLINGIGASNFLSDVRQRVAAFQLES